MQFFHLCGTHDGGLTNIHTSPVLLIIDEWLLLKLTESEARDVFELIHKRRKHSSTIFCSQYRESEWYQQICGGESTLADAIMDRLVANASKIELKGESMRQKLKK